MSGTLSRDGGKVKDAFTVDSYAEDIVADGLMSSLLMTFEHTLEEPDGKAQAEAQAEAYRKRAFEVETYALEAQRLQEDNRTLAERIGQVGRAAEAPAPEALGPCCRRAHLRRPTSHPIPAHLSRRPPHVGEPH